ncbi:MAG: S8 family serine peptidase [Bacteroidia bacterium]|nr:S8 family serine peptidase [Bacteroidia bacterium]MCC6684626.1 S8 family serine peptidase [Bacteroidia bacterium]
MRGIIFLLFFSSGFSAFAQTNYHIYFKDKGDTCLVKPEDFLSPRSLQRRQCQHIQVTYSDYPVCGEYLQQLKMLGIQPTTVSKWFNMVTAVLTPVQYTAILRLPFVLKTEAVRAGGGTCIMLRNQIDSFIPDYYGVPWYRHQLRITHTDVLNANQYRGQGKIIAVMDDGFMNIDKIAAFKHLFTENKIVAVHDFVSNDNEVYTDGSHGTMVLSNIAAIADNKLYGGAYNASFILCRTENDTVESRQEEENWLMAAEYADSIGADVFSTSLGYSKGMTDSLENYVYADMDGNTTLITRAADIAASKGILVINAAGNEGAGNWKYITAPSDGDSVLAVGAVDSTGAKTNFSSVGPSADGRLKPELVTRGGRNYIVGTDGKIYQGNGTSFACPLMSALATSLWSSKPEATAWQIREALIQSAHQYGNPDTLLGYGIPDARKAFYLLHGYYLPEPVDSSELNHNGAGVYPNPAHNMVRIVFENRYLLKEAIVTIRDLYGREIKTGVVALTTDYNEYYLHFSVAGMNTGVYYISLSTTDHIPLHQLKLLIQ